jgi:aqualysin 1
MRGKLVVGACIALASVVLASAAQAGSTRATGSYIVVLKDAVDPAAVAGLHESRYGVTVSHVYGHALYGYAATVPSDRLGQLRSDPNVDFVEAETMMYPLEQVLPWGIDKVEADLSSTRAGNGQGRIDNVDAYIIDTGIDLSHDDLNVVEHVNFVDPPNEDCSGHGTHVSGTVAAKDNAIDVVGMAPGVRLHGVKIFPCGGGSPSGVIIQGVDWVTANAKLPAVANMSLGGPRRASLNRAVRGSVERGIFYAVSAGNSANDSCTLSPASAGRIKGVMTVAATDINDVEASFSSFGPCVDVWAPGVNVLSTRLGGGTLSLSGTSMSSPHVAGAGALYLSQHQDATPAEVEAAIKAGRVKPGTKSKDGKSVRRLDVNDF